MIDDIWANTRSGELDEEPLTDRSPLLDAKVMMVDDEPMMTDLIQAYLEDAGYSDVTQVARKSRACTKYSVNYAFKAKNPSGREILGEACMSYRFVHSIREF